ncbi:MAG: DUF4411 family protein [Betaproteobacteria bacterium]|nr:DUF4411 family protein [Betaproteobacteria bacterium]
MVYLLDADAFIRAKRLHYGFDFCPAFWDWLIANHAKGKVFSVDKVSNELKVGADELGRWAAARGSSFFLKPDQTTVAALTQVSAWIASKDYSTQATAAFMNGADYFLVAQALAGKHTVVTHEIPAPDTSKRRIKIPNVCAGLGVKCLSPFDMLRQEQARFQLGLSS